MRKGRRQRLGLGGTITATSTAGQDPGDISTSGLGSLIANSNLLNYVTPSIDNTAIVDNSYLDRILEEEGPRTLALDPGAFVDTRDQRYVQDAYNYYLGGGTGEVPEATAQIPGAIDTLVDAGGGGGGQDLATGDSVAGFDPGVTPGPSGFIGLDPDMDIDPRDITDYGTYDPPELGGADGMSGGQATPGAEFADQNPYGGTGTLDDLGADTFDDFDSGSQPGISNPRASGQDTVTQDTTTIDTTPTAPPGILNPYQEPMTQQDLIDSDANVGFVDFEPEQQGLIDQAFSKVGSTAENIMEDLSKIPGAVANFAEQTVDVFGKKINVGKTLLSAGINKIVGGPISLVFDALGAIGGILPKDSQKNINARNITAELIAEGAGSGYNMQSGNIGQDPFGRNPISAFGDYDALIEKDLAYTGTNKLGLAKKKYAEQYIDKKEKIELAQTYDMEGTDEGDRAAEEDAAADEEFAVTGDYDVYAGGGADQDPVGPGFGEPGYADPGVDAEENQPGGDGFAPSGQGATADDGFGGYEQGAFADDATGSDTSPGATGGEGGFDDDSFSDANTGFDTSPGATGGEGGGGGSDSCFLAGTLITMADGTTKPVEQVDLGDEVAVGGKVFAVGRFLNTELYDYKGIKVSGSHMVNEDGVWMRIRDTKHGKPLGDDEHIVYVFGSENRRILINGILFTDYFETKEQEKFVENEEDFFNNWKTYENKIDQDNINILNAS